MGSGQSVWHLQDIGEKVSYEFLIGLPGQYDLVLGFSNDDLGVGDDLSVFLGSSQVGTIHTVDTGDWDKFLDAAPVSLGWLEAGRVNITFRLDATDDFGVDLDRFRLVLTN